MLYLFICNIVLGRLQIHISVALRSLEIRQVLFVRSISGFIFRPDNNISKVLLTRQTNQNPYCYHVTIKTFHINISQPPVLSDEKIKDNDNDFIKDDVRQKIV